MDVTDKKNMRTNLLVLAVEHSSKARAMQRKIGFGKERSDVDSFYRLMAMHDAFIIVANSLEELSKPRTDLLPC